MNGAAEIVRDTAQNSRGRLQGVDEKEDGYSENFRHHKL